jgi:hypothetical protein
MTAVVIGGHSDIEANANGGFSQVLPQLTYFIYFIDL